MLPQLIVFSQPFIVRRTPSIIFTLLLSTDSSYCPQIPLLVRKLLLSSAELPNRPQIVRRLSADCPQIVRRLSADCPQIVRKSSAYRPQIVRRSSADSLIIRPADPIVISLSSTNNSHPKLTWPPQKLDSPTKKRLTMKIIVMFPGVSMSAAS